ncbi:MAG TPA: M1 family metallopeptidase [Vicinamibacteria bacterium]|nr:M1 family metallopeptidase [Vicinamibacteria bacterium]
MSPRTVGVALAALAGGVLAFSGAQAAAPRVPRPLPPPAGKDAGLPPLPEVSPRNASYTIEARLDPEKRTIAGTLVLEWRNTSDQALSSFPFHLYWNAFRNNLSTTARGEGRRAPENRKREERTFGWIQVRSVRLLGDSGKGAATEDLTPTIRTLNEDGNADDRTVMEVRTEKPIAPGGTGRFRIEWDALIPYGSAGRAGWVHDYHFVAQWFPKIGVFWKGAWNCHPFYPWTEFFADFGVYDVRLTLPRGFVVGATGRLESRADNSDGSETFRFVQEDVHDFAWTASRRFLERHARFDDAGYPPVDVRLLLQPEHAFLAERYLEAAKTALRTYGTWAAPYPYPQITVVDPAFGSSSGGMEYPTLFTGGASVFAPPELQSPEGVTIHEAGHQFWYGLVANNEFEEAWLDEGFNTYMTSKAIDQALGPGGWGNRYFGVDAGRGGRVGWPVVAPGVRIARGSGNVADLREGGEADVMAKKAWTYRDGSSYGLNSYGKPALVLQTLEGLLGEETMVKVLRTYARRFRFAHPTTEDFIATVDEVTGREWRPFFDQTFFSSDLCDYGVEVKSEAVRRPAGFFEGKDGKLELKAPEKDGDKKKDEGPFESRVTIVRHGGVVLPVELEVDFADGRKVRETWDGRDRWTRFRYEGAKVVRAVVDPDRKIAIDVRPSNNEWLDDEGPARRAAAKWAARYLFWLQNLLELHTVVG